MSEFSVQQCAIRAQSPIPKVEHVLPLSAVMELTRMETTSTPLEKMYIVGGTVA
ncbi:hypothetical protein CIP107503_02297 [Corynebacterium diphtheriae]|nr:hypothetical protein CDIPH_03440 [Corynebacterium diphtheriae]SUY73964.1 Uncharacterised protein [Corynebacterium diphtheriae bv. mitis]CAB0524923.1 hypothetical protein CIP107507_02005 [Corynebacterium diphtheriae]CAB0529470.1 hypothetical protein CIP107503_02297 [Corynebacterium diphtheriae]CAB0530484.1 hypothetical protein CIP100161_02317 [Corynebacterium diphtheriae]